MEEEVTNIVRKYFHVNDYYALEKGEYEFNVSYKDGLKKNFVLLLDEIKKYDYTAEISGTKERLVLVLRKVEKKEEQVSRIAYVLTFLTFGTIIISAVLQVLVYSCIGLSMNPYFVGIVFSLGILAIVLIHELLHAFAARKHGEQVPRFFLIPGLQGITSFLPVVGDVLIHKKYTNRDRFFDIVVAGPIGALIASSIFFVLGQVFYQTVPLTSFQNLSCPYVSVSPISPNVIQLLISSLFKPSTGQAYVSVSVFNDVATIGFLLTFLSLLPCPVLDGGYYALSSFGSRGATISGLLSIIVLLALDSPSYWVIAIGLSFVFTRFNDNIFMDSVSPLSTKRKVISYLLLIVCFLSVPIPQEIFFFRLY